MVIISRAAEKPGTLYKITGESSKPERVFEMQPIQCASSLNGVIMEWWISEIGAYKLHYYESGRDISITEYFIVFGGDTVEDGLYAAQDDISGIINYLRKLRRDKAERKWEKDYRKLLREERAKTKQLLERNKMLQDKLRLAEVIISDQRRAIKKLGGDIE